MLKQLFIYLGFLSCLTPAVGEACPSLAGSYRCVLTGKYPSTDVVITERDDGSMRTYHFAYSAFSSAVPEMKASPEGWMTSSGILFKCTPSRVVVITRDNALKYYLNEYFINPQGDYEVRADDERKILCLRKH